MGSEADRHGLGLGMSESVRSQLMCPSSARVSAASIPISYLYGQELPNTSANSGAVLELCKALDAHGHPVTIFYRRGDQGESAIRGLYGIPDSIRLLPLRTIAGPAQQPFWVLQVRHRAPRSVVISRMGPCAIMAAALRMPAILEMHQLASTIKNWGYWSRLLALVAPRHLSIAVLTQAVADQLDAGLRRRSKSIRVIPSAAADFAGPEQPGPVYDVGYVGSFMPGKGIEKVLQIARELQDASFVIYGDPDRNRQIASDFEALPNVTLAGFVSRAKVGNALRSFRIGLAPYASRGFGGDTMPFVSSSSMSSLKLIEYMSAGCVVVASRMPAVEATVRDGREGLLVEEGDTQAWVEAVRRVLRDPGLCDDLRREARQRFLDHFSFKERALRFSELVLGHGSSSPVEKGGARTGLPTGG